nr:nanor b [Danio rerio]
MDSDSESSVCSGSDSSVEVEDFSPPDSPQSHLVEESTGPLPYQFEPLNRNAPVNAGESDNSPDYANMDVSQWCSCGNCSRLRPEENVCCRDIPEVHTNGRLNGLNCITNDPGFESIALNPTVLQLTNAIDRHSNGEMRNAARNSFYRHVAYRNIVWWCWGYLGREIRVVIPSCAVTRIRQEFPDENENYTGYLPRPM